VSTIFDDRLERKGQVLSTENSRVT